MGGSSAQPDSHRPPEEIREQLVAYLDGELPPEEAARIEEVIARDPEIRSELHRLEETWEMLESLERPTVDESFTHSTLEIVAQSAAAEVEQRKQTKPRVILLQLALAVLVCVLAGGAGYFMVAAWRTDPNAELLADLPVIQRLDALRHIDDIEFVRSLQEAGLFGADEQWWDGSREAADTGLLQLPAAPDDPDPQVRRKWVTELTETQQFLLKRNLDRFRSLPEAERQRLRELYAAIAAAPDREQLEETIDRYYQWFKLLDIYQRSSIDHSKGDERIARIRELREATVMRSIGNIDGRRLRWFLEMVEHRLGVRPTSEDIKTLSRWVEEFAFERGEGVIERLSGEEREQVQRILETIDDDIRRREFLAMTWLSWQAEHPDDFSLLSEKDLESLRERLSEDTRKVLAELPPEEQVKIITRWVRMFVFYRFMAQGGPGNPANRLDEAKLAEFLEKELTPAERNALLQKPADQMYPELIKRYLKWRYPWMELKGPVFGRWGERSRSPGGERPGGPGRGPWGKRGPGDDSQDEESGRRPPAARGPSPPGEPPWGEGRPPMPPESSGEPPRPQKP
ncbi:hypothetical protein JCM19992_08550 [Thermostilla marina]